MVEQIGQLLHNRKSYLILEISSPTIYQALTKMILQWSAQAWDTSHGDPQMELQS
jgi:hypothetical protein